MGRSTSGECGFVFSLAMLTSNRFEIFDEPWKYTYNTPTQQWETQWGLMDANRVLKPNVTIPSCGGKTAS
jgi:hypothetical protein